VSTKDKATVNFDFYGVNGRISKDQTSSALSGSSSTVCRTLSGILRDNADILGDPDDEGRYGTKINYVSLDVEGHEPYVLGCSDLRTLFSSKPTVQVWNIEVANLDGPKLRTVDAAMAFGGFIRLGPNLNHGVSDTFLDDAYLMRRDLLPEFNDVKTVLRPACKDGKRSCPVAEFIASEGKLGTSIQC
jgi:hypothetical protein